MAVAKWPPVRRSLLFGGGGGTKFASCDAILQSSKDVRHDQLSSRCSNEIRHGTCIRLQALKPLAGNHIDNGVASFFQVVGT